MDNHSLATSDFTFTHELSSTKGARQQTGGFLGLNLFGSNNNSNIVNVLIMEELHGENPEMAAYLIFKSISHDACPNLDYICPSSGCSLLQCIIKCAANCEKLYDALRALLEKCKVCRNINHQNKEGDTAGHFALRYGVEDIICQLVEKGLDVSIKNNKGTYIKQEDSYERDTARSDVERVLDDDTLATSDVFNMFGKMRNQNGRSKNNYIRKLVDYFNPDTNTDDSVLFSFKHTDVDDKTEEAPVKSAAPSIPTIFAISTPQTGGGKYTSKMVGTREIFNNSTEVYKNFSVTSKNDSDVDSV
jgi:hypothetical protein